ncbi:MAG TPA: hypothetical protein VG270_05260 [Pseudolabrys sp.]|nr:hypothetical protein [Pseudolabrys sp.]
MRASTEVCIKAFRVLMVTAPIAVGCVTRHAALAEQTGAERADLQRHATTSQIVTFVQSTKISAR